MKEYKRFKDPIYGYIEIENKVIGSIVDTAEFQRLRNVIQTSYSPLYSSAVHNRFVHSLGVYFLGMIAAKSVMDKFPEELNKEEFERFFDVFKQACLLHDVGHAPFSHTGEDFYLDKGDRDVLHQRVIELTGDSELENEIKAKSYKAAPHELMSVIVGLKRYGGNFNIEEKSFFTRCITGYLYVTENDEKHGILNCMISLLNSQVIDVDKLDYLIRDAYITGFDTINIDYIRLLKSVKIKKNKRNDDSPYEIVYEKGAISVIENVVYAHDAEKKWIQNHPVVQYEGYLLKNIFTSLNEKYGEGILFSEKALSKSGIELENKIGQRVTLLCDADIIFLMKNLEGSQEVREYLNRLERRHPLWKSEAEYKAFFDTYFTDEMYKILDETIEKLRSHLNTIQCSNRLNRKALEACEKDIAENKEMYEKLTSDSEKRKYKKQIEQKEIYKKWIEAFKSFADEQENIEFDFVILEQNQFNSGFSKDKLSETKIDFPELKSLRELGSVSTVLRAPKSLREKFFYVFYKRKNELSPEENEDIPIMSLIDKLNNLVKEQI